VNDFLNMSAELEALIRQFDLLEIRDQILAAAKPQLVGRSQYNSEFIEDFFKRYRADSPEMSRFSEPKDWEQHLTQTTPVGTTRVGGLPDLPRNVGWPIHEGKLIPFVAQVQLAELPQIPEMALPQSGLLSFFASGGMKCPDVVKFFDSSPSDLVRQARPDDDQTLADWTDTGVYFPVPIQPLVAIPSFPPLHRQRWDESPNVDPKIGDRVFDMIDHIAKAFGGDATLRIGGYPWLDTVEGLTTHTLRKPGPGPWQLVLEVSSTGTMQWSDSGVFDVLIRPADLSGRDFSKIFAAMSSS
jgi:hypothetical protein